MDFRFEEGLFRFLEKEHILGNADIVGWAGAAKAFLDDDSKDFAMKQVELSHALHCMSEVHLVQHIDCGAYGGSDQFDGLEAEYDFQLEQIDAAREIIQKRYPNIAVKGYIAIKNKEGEVSFHKEKESIKA